MTDQRADLTWRDTPLGRVPVSQRFDDPYYSLDNGLAETAHVFLSGNDLPARLCDGFAVAELGFGTGLNLLALLQAHTGPGHIHFTSFEAFPMSRENAAAALTAFDTLAQRDMVLAQWDAIHTRPTQITPKATVQVITGDARATLPLWEGQADAWFLDGFSPAKNPELWEPALLDAVAAHTRKGGTLATYTAAGHVRRALDAAGFTVTRAAGFGRKRHMTTGRMTDAK